VNDKINNFNSQVKINSNRSSSEIDSTLNPLFNKYEYQLSFKNENIFLIIATLSSTFSNK